MNKINWKIIAGGVLIFGAVKETTSVILDYHSHKITVWPFGALICFFLMIAAGIYLIYKGAKQKNNTDDSKT